MSEEINEARRKLLGATALGFVAAQLGAGAPALAQNAPRRGTTSTELESLYRLGQRRSCSCRVG